MIILLTLAAIMIIAAILVNWDDIKRLARWVRESLSDDHR